MGKRKVAESAITTNEVRECSEAAIQNLTQDRQRQPQRSGLPAQTKGCSGRPREAPIYGCPRFWGFEGPKSAQSLSEFWGFEGPESENLPEACPFLGI